MTQHRELATAIRCAVFDKIEDDGMLVSTNIEQAIEDQLILHAAKGGRPERDYLTESVTVGLREVVEFMQLLNEIMAPPLVVSRARKLLGLSL